MSAPYRFLSSLSMLHWLVVFLSLLLTLTAWQVSSQIAEEKAREQFDHQVEQVNELIRDRMRIYEFALMSGAGAIRASGSDVNLDTWRRFSDSLALDERLPGINGIGVIERVAPERVDAYIEEKRQERPDFQVHPPHNRQDFWPIVYIEPEAANRAAVGLDMAHETNRYQAARKAMQSGETQITGPIVLVQDAEQTPGFLFFYPFYETADVPPADRRESRFSGLVYAPFIMSKLMQGALASANRLVHLRITDGDSRLYSELDENRGENYDDSPMFTTDYTIEMYGREWGFDVQTSQIFEAFNSSRQPAVILMGGIVIDALILLVFILMSNARRRAEHRVNEKTSELQENLAFIRTLTDNLPLAVSVWGPDLTCRFMNAYGERWFPISKSEAIGQPLERFLGEAVVEQRREFYRRALAGEAQQIQTAFADKNGDVHEVVVSYYPLTLGGERCFMATTLDVTDLVQRENELKVLNEELEKQKQEAESAVRTKTAFLANMSHEIRTPMNAIIGMLVLLQDAGLGAHPRRLVRKAFSASEALLQLLNDILDLSKIEADRIELDIQPFEIDTLVHRSVDLFAMVAEEKHLQLRVAVDPATPERVMGDILRISQICTNLVGNAVKFTPEGGVTVRIGFEPDGPARGVLRIAVEDTGIGIRAEDQDRIFQNFRQADESTSRNFGGTGLGLSISLRLARLMEGELTLTSAVGEGSSFLLMVPVRVAEGAHSIGTADSDRPIHILHHGFRKNLALLEDYQAHWGLQVEPVADLSEWSGVMQRVDSAGESEDVFFLLDLEGAEAGPFDEFVEQIAANPDQYPVWSVMVVVPAGYSADWLVPFQQSGGRVSFEPLTPSRLYEHLSQRHRQQLDLKAADRPQYFGVSALVVDDVPLNCEIVTSYLRSFGVEAVSAQTGDEALSLIGQRAFDLIFMDLHLDGETGQEVAERIRSALPDHSPVIAALSASISDIDRATARAAGMEDYLTKPVVPRDIQLLLDTYFGDRKHGALIQRVAPSRDQVEGLPDFVSHAAYERQFGDDTALFERCIRSFVASSHDIRAAADACSSPGSIRELAHKIKGAAANIADTDLADQAEVLEKAPDEAALKTRLMTLVILLEEHANQLDARLAEEPSRAGYALSSTELEETLERIRSRLRRNRVADDGDVDILMDHLARQGHESWMARLRHSLERYEFSQALAVVNEISIEG